MNECIYARYVSLHIHAASGWVCLHVGTLKQLECTRTVRPLTLGGAEEILPAGPQKAGKSRNAGRDLPLQQWTNYGADLQQVVWSDVPVELHLNTSARSGKFSSQADKLPAKQQSREAGRCSQKGKQKKRVLQDSQLCQDT